MLKIIIIIIIILLLFQRKNEMMENLDDNKKCYIENKFIDGEFK